MKKGDHYRTRLTHTLEVNQISRGIASNLHLNERLAEAIALGHDIGHTPFGHAGEKILDDIMRGNEGFDGKLQKIDYGGFKHNFNSAKILDIVEKEYQTHRGLNLTWQVLEGIIKHTRIIKENKVWNWKRFVKDPEFLEEFLYDPKNIKKENIKNFSVTLEGQIVNVADEIAQREHDLDDCFHEPYLRKDIQNKINKIIDKIIQKNKKEYPNECKVLQNLKEQFIECADIETIFGGELMTKKLISYFISDVTRNSLENIKKIKDNNQLNEIITETQFKNSKRKYLNKELIKFSPIAQIFNDNLENLITNKIINSYEVSRFDAKAEYIIKHLFKAYYSNPLQMRKEYLSLIQEFLKYNSKTYYNIKLENEEVEHLQDISIFLEDEFESTPSNLDLLFDILKLKKLNLIKWPKNLNNEEILNKHGEFKKDFFKKHVLPINNKNNNLTDSEKFLKALLENHYIFIEVIVDYISKLTDNMARDDYHDLYVT